jgi:hypothetical protein
VDAIAAARIVLIKTKALWILVDLRLTNPNSYVRKLSGHDLTIGYRDRIVGRHLNIALAAGEVLLCSAQTAAAKPPRSRRYSACSSHDPVR